MLAADQKQMKHNAKMNLIPSVIKVVESLVTLSHLETVLIQYFHSLGFALILMLIVLGVSECVVS